MHGPSGPSPKLLGRIAAGVMGVVFLAIIWWSIGRGSATAPNSTRGPDLTDAPDITEVETGRSIVLTMIDRDDPSRVASVIEADRLDPAGAGERLLTNPRAWLYPKGDRVVRVLADQARLVMPGNEVPESGTLEGSVRVLVYEASGTPGQPPADDAEPIMTASFDQPVRFERRYLRLSSAGAFKIDSDQFEFQGEDLTVMLNEVQRRLELLDVQRGGRLRIKLAGAETTPDTATADTPPAAPAQGTPPQNTPPQSPPSDPLAAADHDAMPQSPPAEPPAPKVDLYKTVLNESVIATVGSTRVDADRLDLFTRLTNNRLPTETIARVAFVRTVPTEEPTPEPAPESAPESTPDPAAGSTPDSEPGVLVTADGTPPNQQSGPQTGPQTDTPSTAITPPAPPAPDALVLTWTGPMNIRPLDSTAVPEQLAEDDAALAMHANEGGTVRIADESAGLTGEVGAIRYGATRAVLHLDPIPVADAPADPLRLAMTDAGRGRFAGVRADLRTGLIDLAGPANARSRTDAAIDWIDTARLTLGVDDEGRLTDRLTGASFSGRVEATQEGGRINAATLATTFEPDAQHRAALRSAVITDGSLAADPGDADLALPRSLAADSIRVDFTGPAGRPDPVRVEATGSVRGMADGATLDADHATADLARDQNDALFVRTAHAEGAVRYTDTNDTRASGDTLSVDGQAETIRLTGPDASVAQGDSTILGPVIDLDARTRRMAVDGAGRFDHTLRTAEGLPAGKVLARWTETMRFDDALGRLAARGDVSVISAPEPNTRDTLTAQRVEVEITPQPIRDAIGGRPAAKRELQIARAFGDSTADTPRPATVETRRYDPDDPERVIGLLYLEGDQVIADARRSTLRVPGAGTLLILDRRHENAPPGDPAGGAPDPLGGAAGPGLTRFTWADAFDLDRTTGVSVMDGSVLVRHKTIGGGPNNGQIAELATDKLTATFAEINDADKTAFALGSADASGSVVFRASGKQLFADGARYQATDDILHALAAPGRLVELREPGRAAPLSARAIRWDLRNDLIEINRPSPVTLPN